MGKVRGDKWFRTFNNWGKRDVKTQIDRETLASCGGGRVEETVGEFEDGDGLFTRDGGELLEEVVEGAPSF